MNIDCGIANSITIFVVKRTKGPGAKYMQPSLARTILTMFPQAKPVEDKYSDLAWMTINCYGKRNGEHDYNPMPRFTTERLST